MVDSVAQSCHGVTEPQAHQAQAENFAVALMRALLVGDAGCASFAIFIFVSMLAYSGEELILDPFSRSRCFGLHARRQSTAADRVALHGGVFVGMIVQSRSLCSTSAATCADLDHAVLNDRSTGCVGLGPRADQDFQRAGFLAPSLAPRCGPVCFPARPSQRCIRCLRAWIDDAHWQASGGRTQRDRCAAWDVWGASQGVRHLGAGGLVEQPLQATWRTYSSSAADRPSPPTDMVFAAEATCFVAARSDRKADGAPFRHE